MFIQSWSCVFVSVFFINRSTLFIFTKPAFLDFFLDFKKNDRQDICNISMQCTFNGQCTFDIMIKRDKNNRSLIMQVCSYVKYVQS